MTRVRKTHGEGFKFEVALAALNGERTLGELSREYGVPVGALQKWRGHLDGEGRCLFAGKRRRRHEAIGLAGERRKSTDQPVDSTNTCSMNQRVSRVLSTSTSFTRTQL